MWGSQRKAWVWLWVASWTSYSFHGTPFSPEKLFNRQSMVIQIWVFGRHFLSMNQVSLLLQKINDSIFDCNWIHPGFPGGSAVKNLRGATGDTDSSPGLGRFPGEGDGNLLSIPSRIIHGQRSLVGYSPWGVTVRHNWASMHTTKSKLSSGN